MLLEPPFLLHPAPAKPLVGVLGNFLKVNVPRAPNTEVNLLLRLAVLLAVGFPLLLFRLILFRMNPSAPRPRSGDDLLSVFVRSVGR